MSAVLLIRQGWGVRQTARHFGVSPSTISKWVAKAPSDGRLGIPTKSSRPHTSPNRISFDLEQLIVTQRLNSKRCGQVIHAVLNKQGVTVSLATVHRVLDRYQLTKRYSPWKRRHHSLPRPTPEKPGILVQVDTVHEMVINKRFYVYTLIDVCSRWACAWASKKANVAASLKFVRGAAKQAPFEFQTLQSDHGSEFSQSFTERIAIVHRHSRVRKPNDNGHVERFNRTLREECLDGLTKDVYHYNMALKEYLNFYNNQRPHMSLNYEAPMHYLEQVFPRS